MSLQKIEIKTAQGLSTVSVEQFLALPLDARLKLILGGSVRFFDENGELTAKDGMRLLRGSRAATGIPAARGLAPDALALKDFMSLPLDERLKVVMERRVPIYDELGAEVPLKDALRIARDRSTAR